MPNVLARPRFGDVAAKVADDEYIINANDITKIPNFLSNFIFLPPYIHLVKFGL
jgi:hypothetical protein